MSVQSVDLGGDGVGVGAGTRSGYRDVYCQVPKNEIPDTWLWYLYLWAYQ